VAFGQSAVPVHDLGIGATVFDAAKPLRLNASLVYEQRIIKTI
jgi:hypothetical protein